MNADRFMTVFMFAAFVALIILLLMAIYQADHRITTEQFLRFCIENQIRAENCEIKGRAIP